MLAIKVNKFETSRLYLLCHLLHPINSVIADPADSFALLGPTLQAIDTGDIQDVSLAELKQNLEQTLVEEGRGDGVESDRDNERGDEVQVLAVQGANMDEEGPVQGANMSEDKVEDALKSAAEFVFRV